MLTSLAGAMALFFAGIPRIIGFLIILIIGWFVATLIGKAVGALLRTVNFDGFATRAGISDFVKKMGVDTDASGFLAAIVKWFVRLIVLVVAFDALGLPAVSDVLRQMLLWLPNLVVALVVIILGGLAAKAMSSVVRGATAKAGFSNPDLLAKVASFAVWTFTIVVAVNQIGVAATLVNTLFMGAIGALALALGLAFGLGGRESAARVLEKWHDQAQAASPKLEKAADEGAALAKAKSSSLGGPSRTGGQHK
ncbi:MAG: small-conductance mechanosensitive ion channel [Casimicrobiaceae bacterium]